MQSAWAHAIDIAKAHLETSDRDSAVMHDAFHIHDDYVHALRASQRIHAASELKSRRAWYMKKAVDDERTARQILEALDTTFKCVVRSWSGGGALVGCRVVHGDPVRASVCVCVCSCVRTDAAGRAPSSALSSLPRSLTPSCCTRPVKRTSRRCSPRSSLTVRRCRNAVLAAGGGACHPAALCCSAVGPRRRLRREQRERRGDAARAGARRSAQAAPWLAGQDRGLPRHR